MLNFCVEIIIDKLMCQIWWIFKEKWSFIFFFKASAQNQKCFKYFKTFLYTSIKWLLLANSSYQILVTLKICYNKEDKATKMNHQWVLMTTVYIFVYRITYILYVGVAQEELFAILINPTSQLQLHYQTTPMHDTNAWSSL